MRRSVLGLALLLCVVVVSPARAATATDPVPTQFVELSPPLGMPHHEPVRAGMAISVGAFLRAGSDPVQWRAVRLEAAPAGQTTFHTVATSQTGGHGQAYAISAPLYTNTSFRWAYDGDSTYGPTVSPTWVEFVEPAIGVRVSDRTPRVGQRVVVRGRTTPPRAGRKVSVWTGPRNCWCDVAYVPGAEPTARRLARGVVRADGSYRLVIRFSSPGKQRIHVHVKGGGGLTPGDSAYARLRVG